MINHFSKLDDKASINVKYEAACLVIASQMDISVVKEAERIISDHYLALSQMWARL